MIENRLKEIWGKLQSKKPHMPNFLEGIRLRGIRGIDNLRVMLDYPVCVIAGENGSGKTTVLSAAVCAYHYHGGPLHNDILHAFFPDDAPRYSGRRNVQAEFKIEYEYTTEQGASTLCLQCKKEGVGFITSSRGKQPERGVYLRPANNLSSPSELLDMLRNHRPEAPAQVVQLTAAQIDLARQMLPFEYRGVVRLYGGTKSSLFVDKKDGVSYSEAHMSSGERTIFRLVHEISQLEDALVLIDEIETGLHPRVQKLLMLQLQNLSLCKNLQIIVATHSPVILDSVHPSGRIFLARNEWEKIVVRPAYRDIIQNALYGRSKETLNLLCEDRAAEGILHGVMDHLSPDQQIRPDSVHIGRDTSASEFPGHAAAFRKFDLLKDFVFVLDGDQRNGKIEEKIRAKSGPREISVLYLPSDLSPEAWVWKRLKSKPEFWASHLHVNAENLANMLTKLDAVYNPASDSRSNIVKQRVANLGKNLKQDTPNICRTVARVEVSDPDSDIQPLVGELKNVLTRWREE